LAKVLFYFVLVLSTTRNVGQIKHHGQPENGRSAQKAAARVVSFYDVLLRVSESEPDAIMDASLYYDDVRENGSSFPLRSLHFVAKDDTPITVTSMHGLAALPESQTPE
jgi:hypothetical protein